MSLTKEIIKKLRNEGIHVSKPMEQYLLNEYLEEAFPYSWNDEYEAYVEIKGVVDAHKHTGTQEFLEGRYDRLIEVRDTLCEMYVDLKREYMLLEEHIPLNYDGDNPCDSF